MSCFIKDFMICHRCFPQSETDLFRSARRALFHSFLNPSRHPDPGKTIRISNVLALQCTMYTYTHGSLLSLRKPSQGLLQRWGLVRITLKFSGFNETKMHVKNHQNCFVKEPTKISWGAKSLVSFFRCHGGYPGQQIQSRWCNITKCLLNTWPQDNVSSSKTVQGLVKIIRLVSMSMGNME